MMARIDSHVKDYYENPTAHGFSSFKPVTPGVYELIHREVPILLRLELKNVFVDTHLKTDYFWRRL